MTGQPAKGEIVARGSFPPDGSPWVVSGPRLQPEVVLADYRARLPYQAQCIIPSVSGVFSLGSPAAAFRAS